jgi:hypothetical protein
VTTLDHLRVASHKLDVRPSRRVTHSANNLRELIKGEAFLQNEGRADVKWSCPRHRQVVDGTVNRQIAD